MIPFGLFRRRMGTEPGAAVVLIKAVIAARGMTRVFVPVVLSLAAVAGCAGTQAPGRDPAKPASPGGTWTLSVMGVPQAPGDLPSDVNINLVIDDVSGEVSGSAGCNQFHGTCHLDGEHLTITGLSLTKRLCPSPKGIMERERAFVTALQGADRFTIEDGHLVLRDGTDQVLVFTREAVSTGGQRP